METYKPSLSAPIAWMKIVCLAAALVCFGFSAFGAAITWTNQNDGYWSAITNWSPQQVPAAADDVTMTGGDYTVTVDIPAFANSLTMNAGSPIIAGPKLRDAWRPIKLG